MTSSASRALGAMADTDEGAAIDDSLYSRQRYVLGDAAMRSMASSSVLVVGAGGLGVEIAKNIILAGVRSLTLQDHRAAALSDLGTHFFLQLADVQLGCNRAQASLARLAELNSYVGVEACTDEFCCDRDWSFLRRYQCVVLTEVPWDVQVDADRFCRQQEPPIKVISTGVRGLFTYLFCDFGDNFEVKDINGEEPMQHFICNITKDNPGVVTTYDARPHGLEDGEAVTFREVRGMEKLNEMKVKVKVVSPYEFSIGDTSSAEFDAYTGGGIVVQVKEPRVLHFSSLENELSRPTLSTPDLAKFTAPVSIHLAFLTLREFQERFSRLPSAWDEHDCHNFLELARGLKSASEWLDEADEELLKYFSYTAAGCFAPLCAIAGGMAAQEALKAVTGKFSPLQQWFHLDATELIAGVEKSPGFSYVKKDDRYDYLRVCIGDALCQQLAELKAFMVGCGAIGCEMLKNFALLGVGTRGLLTITDHDLIEKSNLNRQFLFRPHHIQQPKSKVAAASALTINPELKIVAQQDKVWSETESTVHNDEFLLGVQVVVSALDNVEARRYIDQRCVATARPLLESGTTGMKGHVQVIVPHVTESYGSQNDPVDEDVPFCTVKSFPAKIEHCMIWAKSKFESSFSEKPSFFNKFWFQASNPEQILKRLAEGENVAGSPRALHVTEDRAETWEECVALARLKFEKYFNHKAKNLLRVYPMDQIRDDGEPFWKLPRRPPNPIEFNSNDALHMTFIASCAKLYAEVFRLRPTQQDLRIESMQALADRVNVPAFNAGAAKRILADESAKREDVVPAVKIDLTPTEIFAKLEAVRTANSNALTPMSNLTFEKDDDTNGHLDYIAASTNLRAIMYGIEQSDRYTIKRVVGKIIPAIATTTAVISGLVSIELLKVLQQRLVLASYKNCFLNLALPVMVLSEPGAAKRITVRDGLTFTLWDKWVIKGGETYTIQQFIDRVKKDYDLNVSMIVHMSKMVYSTIMPWHQKKLVQSMNSLIKRPPDRNYVDLAVCFDIEIDSPPVRYYFS